MKISDININQIYHTSHCGSTLMATLLANSTIVYSEPSWASNLLFNKDLELTEDYNNIVVKFGSGYCPFVNNIPGKKVFLYRKLKHHLFKIKSSSYIESIISSKYEHHLNNCHSSLNPDQFKTDLEKIAFMWLNNVQWIKENKDILWIETNSFLKNKRETIDLVCDHFKIDRVMDFELSNVYVKSLGINGKDTAVNDTELPIHGTMKTLYPSFGIVENDLCDQCSEINDLVLLVSGKLPDISDNLLK
jgi:hypothetical protein